MTGRISLLEVDLRDIKFIKLRLSTHLSDIGVVFAIGRKCLSVNKISIDSQVCTERPADGDHNFELNNKMAHVCT